MDLDFKRIDRMGFMINNLSSFEIIIYKNHEGTKEIKRVFI